MSNSILQHTILLISHYTIDCLIFTQRKITLPLLIVSGICVDLFTLTYLVLDLLKVFFPARELRTNIFSPRDFRSIFEVFKRSIRKISTQILLAYLD